MMTLTLFALIVLLAYLYGMTSGFVDGGGIASAVITTRVMEPLPALVIVGISEVLGMFLLGQAVAGTFGHSMVSFPLHSAPGEILRVLLAALIGALVWNFSMWRLAVPSSSGHALIGGLVGAVIAIYGFSAIHWAMIARIFLYLAIVPILGCLLGACLAVIIGSVGGYVTPGVGGVIRKLQIAGLIGTALAHGGNDGQKSLGIMLLAFIALQGAAAIPAHLPWLIVLFCSSSLVLGLFLGSRRTIETLGSRLLRLNPIEGFCAQIACTVLLGASTLLGYPMSTTHVMSTSVIGSGAAAHPRAVDWDLALDMLTAWIITVPSSCLLSAFLAWGMKEILRGLS